MAFKQLQNRRLQAARPKPTRAYAPGVSTARNPVRTNWKISQGETIQYPLHALAKPYKLWVQHKNVSNVVYLSINISRNIMD